jgi:isopenicillin N synthase-like dioxygenase
MSQSPIPVIDLAAFDLAGPTERGRVVAEVRKALEEVGFLVISGHGVPQSLIDRTNEASLEFFDLPEQEKNKYLPTKPGSRGYNAFKGRTVGLSHDPTYKRSLQESFAVGRITVPANDPYFTSAEAGHSFAPNIWPERPGDFQKVMSDYWNEMDRLYRVIMRLFAVALELPERYFDATIDKHSSLLRLTHYPALDSEPLPGEFRSGAHTDGGPLTILHIDDTPDSLQVKLRDGSWVFVNKVPGTFIINIGDMMMRWTNDKWLSNWHQVVNPPMVDGRSARRLSLVYFCSTNYDTLVACLPNCSGPGKPALYPPVISGKYAEERFKLRYGIEEPARQSA